jgi:hypothetical protein
MNSINFDDLPWYTKRELAVHQLDCAIRLVLDDDDVICAVTLAGAAEEILGKLVEQLGKKHSLRGFIDECMARQSLRPDEAWKRKDFADIANHFRNELKHYAEGSDIAVTPDAAYDLIDRAAENLRLLEGQETEQVRRYMNWRWSQ